MKRVLIAGGTGFIGSFLAKELKKKGYEVIILTRQTQSKTDFELFYWDISKGEIQTEALNNVDFIINLAGENISDGRWTKGKKKSIEESRVKSTGILFEAVKNLNKKPEAYISASAIGFYGTFNSKKIFVETDESGDDFLAAICSKWEKAANKFQTLGIRTSILRTGVVFSVHAGAFPQITQTLKFGFISAIGSGKQYVPWIHIDDLVSMYIYAIENKDFHGTYNAVVPEHITQDELIDKIRSVSGKRFKVPNIPGFILKAMFGEMASILLYGSRVSSDKILKTDFNFKFPNIDIALSSLLNKTGNK